MQIINYDNLIDIPIAEVQDNQTWWKTTSWVSGVDNEMINAQVSVYNFPEMESVADWDTNITWSSSAYNKIAWTAWTVNLPNWVNYPVLSWEITLQWVTYIYYNRDVWTVWSSLTASDAVLGKNILLCVAKPNSDITKKAIYQAFGTLGNNIMITADNIAANTITSNEIAANTITTNQLSATAIDGMTITGATIQTASTWERFRMTSSEIAYYDVQGNKRVEFTSDWIYFYDENWNGRWGLFWWWSYLETRWDLYSDELYTNYLRLGTDYEYAFEDYVDPIYWAQYLICTFWWNGQITTVPLMDWYQAGSTSTTWYLYMLTWWHIYRIPCYMEQ